MTSGSAATSSPVERYLARNEYIVLETRQHPLAIVGSMMNGLGLLLPLAMIAWGVRGIELLRNPLGEWMLRLIFLAMLVVIARLLVQIVGWELERITVTNHKVIHMHGVLSKRIASTPLLKISELAVRQPLLGRMFGYGSLVVDVPGGQEQALHGLGFLPDPSGIYRLIGELSRADRAAAGNTVRAGVSHAVVPSVIPPAEATTVIDLRHLPGSTE